MNFLISSALELSVARETHCFRFAAKQITKANESEKEMKRKRRRDYMACTSIFYRILPGDFSLSGRFMMNRLSGPINEDKCKQKLNAITALDLDQKQRPAAQGHKKLETLKKKNAGDTNLLCIALKN